MAAAACLALLMVVVACAAVPDPPQLAEPSNEQPVVLALEVDPQTVTVGGSITVTLYARALPDGVLSLPDEFPRMSELRISNDPQGTPLSLSPGGTATRTWRARVLALDGFDLPALTVTFQQGDDTRLVETAPVHIEVTTNLAEGEAETQDIRDIKAPIRPPRPWWIWLVVAAVASALAVALFLLLRRRHRGVASEPSRPAEELALEAIDRLRRRQWTSAAQVRHAFFSLSEIVRRFVEARFELNATDLTTEEILNRLHAVSAKHPDAAVTLRVFLRRSDDARFGPGDPGSTLLPPALDLAESIVRACTQSVPGRGVEQAGANGMLP